MKVSKYNEVRKLKNKIDEWNIVIFIKVFFEKIKFVLVFLEEKFFVKKINRVR